MTTPHSSDLLAPAPANPTQTRVGYPRVSTGGPKAKRRLDAPRAAGLQQTFHTDRPWPTACLAVPATNNTPAAPSLDRLSRPLTLLTTAVEQWYQHDVGSPAAGRARARVSGVPAHG